jgi:hypothetical protein
MNFGFNSNVRAGDALYHVQTEDRGAAHPFLDTVVYQAGRVVYKRSTNYEQFAKGAYPETLQQKLHERLAQQHREVIAELEAGTLPFQSKEQARPAPVPSEAGAQNGLQLRLVNPQTWFAAGSATLQIELSEANSKQRVAGADVRASVENENQRIPCGEEVLTDAQGCATLRFPMPAMMAEGSSLVVRASDGSRQGELRFKLKTKPREPAPAPASR